MLEGQLDTLDACFQNAILGGTCWKMRQEPQRPVLNLGLGYWQR